MKKKVKDLTIGEIIEACRKSKDCRHDCPLFVLDALSLPCGTIYEETDKNALEREVDI